MEKFPNINKDKFAVLFIDRNTGHVLDIDFNVSIADEQKCYTVFNQLSDAKEFGEHKTWTTDQGNKNVGYYIYDNKEQVVFHTDNLQTENANSKLLEVIREFQFVARTVAEEFYKKYNRKDLLKGYHDKTIPKEGKLSDIVREYSFHGAGLYAQLKDKEIDFDFGPDNRVDGFDAMRLAQFANSQKDLKGIWSEIVIQQKLKKLRIDGVIFKPGSHPGTGNYYLTETIGTNSTLPKAGRKWWQKLFSSE
jgi:hypothetical protein